MDLRTVECFRPAEGVRRWRRRRHRHPRPRPPKMCCWQPNCATPQPRAGWVPRPRLVRRLLAGTERELVLVCGPAGFGKSSLLADWVRGDRSTGGVAVARRRRQRPGAVLAPRHRRARRRARPASSSGSARSCPAPAGTPFAGAVTALVNEFAAAADEVALVIDDYHLVESPDVHRSMEFLLDHLPPALHLVLASRSDPPLPLARLRARGQLAELRAGDLRFTAGGGRRAAAHRGRGSTCPTPSSRRSAIAPRAGPRACTSRRCRCRAAATSPGSSRSSPGATGSCSTTSPRRCWSASPPSCGRSCWRPRSSTGCAARSATRWSGARTASSCWSRWSGPACS